jgi:hypothetical protein
LLKNNDGKYKHLRKRGELEQKTELEEPRNDSTQYAKLKVQKKWDRVVVTDCHQAVYVSCIMSFCSSVNSSFMFLLKSFTMFRVNLAVPFEMDQGEILLLY